jgi:hypothetical protein
MSASIHAIDRAVDRDRRGRFQPGCSGNPHGKAPGTLNRATVLKQLMATGDEETIVRQIIARAKGGEWAAQRFVFDCLAPKSRQRPIELVFPAGATVLEMYEQTLTAMSDGAISPDEANQIARYIDRLELRRAAAAAQQAADADLHSPCKPADESRADHPAKAPATREGLRKERVPRAALHPTCKSRPARRRHADGDGLPSDVALVAAAASSLHSTCISPT